MSVPQAREGKGKVSAIRSSNAFRLYKITELAKILGVDLRYLYAIRDAGAPFAFGRARPEWILEWLKQQADEGTLKGPIPP